MHQEVTKLRPIVKDDGSITQKDLVLRFMQELKSDTAGISDASVPIDSSLVPRLVDARQFEAIQLCRRARFGIEKERIKAGLPVDGKRTARFKLVNKHLQASNRIRGENGAFLRTTGSIRDCDELK